MKTVGLILALVLIAGPWVWASMAVAADPSQADAQGAYTLASYASMILVPLGLVVLALTMRKR